MASSYKAFTKAKQAEFLQHLRDGLMRGAAADVLELDRRKVREFISTEKDFEAAVLDAEVDATEHVQEALYQAAISGNVSASKVWLEMHGSKEERASAKGATKRISDPDAPEDPADFSELDAVTPIDALRRRRNS